MDFFRPIEDLLGKFSSKLHFRETNRNVLTLNDEWGTEKGGISTVHREISCLAKEAGAGVYSTVLEADDVDKYDAQKRGINLITPTVNPKLSPLYKIPNLDWFLLHRSYFPSLSEVEDFKIVIGHVPISSDAASEIQSLFPEEQETKCLPMIVHGHEIPFHLLIEYPGAKAFLFNHVIPEDIDVYKPNYTPERVQDEEAKILDAAGKADVIFSVGPRIFKHFENKFRALPKAPRHLEFIPKPEKKFFDVEMKKPSKLTTVRVITFGRIKGVEKLKGYDLVAAALSKVADAHCRRPSLVPCPVWVIRGVPEDEHKETMAFLKKYITSGYLDVKLYPYGSQDEVCVDLQQSHLCIMASRTEPFGLVGMEAMAVGIPTLITKRSGLAEFMEREFQTQAESIVVNVGINERSKSSDIEAWKTAILGLLSEYGDAFDLAQKLKRGLNENAAIKESHDRFKDLCLKA